MLMWGRKEKRSRAEAWLIALADLGVTALAFFVYAVFLAELARKGFSWSGSAGAVAVSNLLSVALVLTGISGLGAAVSVVAGKSRQAVLLQLLLGAGLLLGTASLVLFGVVTTPRGRPLIIPGDVRTLTLGALMVFGGWYQLRAAAASAERSSNSGAIPQRLN
jgi:hypothetical protein